MLTFFVSEIKSDYFPRDYRFVLVMKIQFVFCEVRSEFLNIHVIARLQVVES
jgi:hypothetical protein